MTRYWKRMALVFAASIFAGMTSLTHVEQAEARKGVSVKGTITRVPPPPRVVRDHGTGHHGTTKVYPSKPGGKVTPQTRPPRKVCAYHRGCKIVRDHRP